MTATLERGSKTKLTEAEYLELERQSEVRHEFIDGRMLEMPGASLIHEDVIFNITTTLASAIKSRKCRAAFGGTQMRAPSGRIYYPDVMISCLEPNSKYV